MKNPPANAGDIRDTGSIPGSGGPPGGGTGSQYSFWKIPWTEDPGGLQFRGLQRVGHNCVCTHTQYLNDIND